MENIIWTSGPINCPAGLVNFFKLISYTFMFSCACSLEFCLFFSLLHSKPSDLKNQIYCICNFTVVHKCFHSNGLSCQFLMHNKFNIGKNCLIALFLLGVFQPSSSWCKFECEQSQVNGNILFRGRRASRCRCEQGMGIYCFTPWVSQIILCLRYSSDTIPSLLPPSLSAAGGMY